MTAVGHEDRFRPLRLSAGSRLGLPTFSWTHNRVREAPIAGAQGPFIARFDGRGRYLAKLLKPVGAPVLAAEPRDARKTALSRSYLSSICRRRG